MATVDSEVTCKRCKYANAYDSFNTRSMESTTICGQCGYHHRYRFVTGELEAGGGFGSMYISYNRFDDGRLVSGGLSETISLKFRRRLELRTAKLQRLIQSPRVASVEMTVKVRGKWSTLTLKSTLKPGQRKEIDYKFARQPVQPYVPSHQPRQLQARRQEWQSSPLMTCGTFRSDRLQSELSLVCIKSYCTHHLILKGPA